MYTILVSGKAPSQTVSDGLTHPVWLGARRSLCAPKKADQMLRKTVLPVIAIALCVLLLLAV